MVGLWSKTPLWLRVMGALVLGIGAGLYWGKDASIYFKPLGDAYVNAIKMLVLPLVFFTIASSLPKLGQTGRAVGLGIRTFVLFIVTSLLAVGVGLSVGLWLDPGAGLTALPISKEEVRQIPTLTEVLVGLIPANIFKAFAEGKVLSVLVVALLTGAALLSLGEKADKLKVVIEQGSTLMFKITSWVIQTTPFGVFGLIASVVGDYGLETLSPLLTFIGAIYLACLIQLFVVYPLLLKLHGLKVLPFWAGVFGAQQTAFAICSSLGSLPVSLTTAVDTFKVPAGYAGFALPLGANMKMDACGAIYPAIASIFIAHYFGITLTPMHYVLITLTAVLGSLATAGVPGTATVMLTLTLSTAGLPLEGLGLLVAIDRIIDMIRTATNVTGQILVPVLVARQTGLLPEESPLRQGRLGQGKIRQDQQNA